MDRRRRTHYKCLRCKGLRCCTPRTFQSALIRIMSVLRPSDGGVYKFFADLINDKCPYCHLYFVRSYCREPMPCTSVMEFKFL